MLVALVAVAIAVLMTLLWLGARDDGSSEPAPDAERRIAELETQVARAQDDLAGADADVAEARSDLTRAQEDLAATEARLAATEARLAALETADEESARVQAELEAAEASILELEQERVAAEQALADAALEAERDPADFDARDAPEFARWVGELLSSRTGSSRLGQDAAVCFGAEVIGLIGIDAVGAGQHNAASGAARQTVIDAMNQAASICRIDPGLIFG